MPRYKEDFVVVYVPRCENKGAEYARLEKLLKDIDPDAKRLQESIWSLSAWDKSSEAIGGRLRHSLKMIWRREKLPPLDAELTCVRFYARVCSRLLELPLP